MNDKSDWEEMSDLMKIEIARMKSRRKALMLWFIPRLALALLFGAAVVYLNGKL